jgi:hypothetical protein
MAGDEWRGWLLRIWRDQVAKMTQRQVAEAISTTKSVISMWESAERGLTSAHLSALDRCYGAGGALVDIAMAIGTPAGLAPRTTWFHNPQGPSGPVWAWCRPQRGRRHISVHVRWGAFAFDVSSACDDNGIFLTSPVSTPSPSACVHLQERGWVDFGRGAIPEQLGIPTFDALSGVRVEPHELIRQVFSVTDAPRAILDLTRCRPPVTTAQPFTPDQWRRLRDCRSFSRRAAALLATDLMPDHPVTDDQLHELEKGGRPRPAFLRSRLDEIYRADGCTGTEEVPPGRSTPATHTMHCISFDFPKWWIGPVWFRFTAAHGTAARVELRCDRHRKQLRVPAGGAVACRKPTGSATPFVVLCPKMWHVTAGMGVCPGAWDVNWAWTTVDDGPRQPDEVHDLLLGLLGRSKEQFDEALRRINDTSASPRGGTSRRS